MGGERWLLSEVEILIANFDRPPEPQLDTPEPIPEPVEGPVHELIDEKESGDICETAGEYFTKTSEFPASESTNKETITCKLCGAEVPRRGRNNKFCENCTPKRYRAMEKQWKQAYRSVPVKEGYKRLKIAEVISTPFMLNKVQNGGYDSYELPEGMKEK